MKIPFSKAIFCMLIGASAAGCYTKDEQINHEAQISGQVQAQAQIEATREDNDRRSRELEARLAEHERFYQSVGGAYEGTFELNRDEVPFRKVRIEFTPSSPPVLPSRGTRTEAEITSDLVALHFDVLLNFWQEGDLQPTGKVFTGIIADTKNGEINLVAAGYPLILKVWISSGIPQKKDATYSQITSASGRLADALRTGDAKGVPELWAEISGEHIQATTLLLTRVSR